MSIEYAVYLTVLVLVATFVVMRRLHRLGAQLEAVCNVIQYRLMSPDERDAATAAWVADQREERRRSEHWKEIRGYAYWGAFMLIAIGYSYLSKR